jgi:hypothetical protein
LVCTCQKVFLCARRSFYWLYYNEKEYKCNKNIPCLNNFLFDIFLIVISICYIFESEVKRCSYPVTGKDSHAV